MNFHYNQHRLNNIRMQQGRSLLTDDCTFIPAQDKKHTKKGPPSEFFITKSYFFVTLNFLQNFKDLVHPLLEEEYVA